MSAHKVVRVWELSRESITLDPVYRCGQCEDGKYAWVKPVGWAWKVDSDRWLASELRDISNLWTNCFDGTPPTWTAPGYEWGTQPGDPGFGLSISSEKWVSASNAQTIPRPKSERCKYASKPTITNGDGPRFLEPLDYYRGRERAVAHVVGIPKAKYDAPKSEQEGIAADRVIKHALRALREIPLCTVTGEPVMVKAVVCTDAAIAVFHCEACSKAK